MWSNRCLWTAPLPTQSPFCYGRKQFGHNLRTGVFVPSGSPRHLPERVISTGKAPALSSREARWSTSWSGVGSGAGPHALLAFLSWGVFVLCAQLLKWPGSTSENKNTSLEQQPKSRPAPEPPFRRHTSLERHQIVSIMGPSLRFCC